MSDPDIIALCYAEEVKKVYSTYMTSYFGTLLEKDKAKINKIKKAADDTFVAGIQLARELRDHALNLATPG